MASWYLWQNRNNKMRICIKMQRYQRQDIRTRALSFLIAILFSLNFDLCSAGFNSKKNETQQQQHDQQQQQQQTNQLKFTNTSMIAIPAAALTTTVSNIGSVEPYLEDPYAATNVTAQIGTHAYLPCRVKQLGNKSVSWIRVRDGHILTVDRAVFIADQRFLSLKQPDKFWTLQIKYVQARDAGAYECQVSTEPKVSARVHLQVVVPRTEILGDPDRYIKAGSTVVLRCIVRGALEPPTFIMWYHGTEQLAADSRRHRMQIDRNPSEVEGETHSTIGSLIIETARKRDTGNYTCSPSNSPSVTVTLNVINGESSASAVTSSAPVVKSYTACILTLLCSVFLFDGHRT